ncbi:MAG: ABC transporter permease [Planctomycetota bacterium]
MPNPTDQSETTISGIHAMRGGALTAPKGFWAGAWSQVLKRPGAVAGLIWFGFIALLAVYAPLIANGHPLLMRELDANGDVVATSSPLLEFLAPSQWVLLVAMTLLIPLVLLPISGTSRGQRAGAVIGATVQAFTILLAVSAIRAWLGRWGASDAEREFLGSDSAPAIVAATGAFIVSALFAFIPTIVRLAPRLAVVGVSGVVAGVIVAGTWSQPPETFQYEERELAGEIETVYTLVPWSPAQRPTDRSAAVLEPGATSAQALMNNVTIALPRGVPIDDASLALAARDIERLPLEGDAGTTLAGAFARQFPPSSGPTIDTVESWLMGQLAPFGTPYALGTDGLGQDVLSQMIHACRLSISIGVVSTSIAVLIGVTIGALMGYFGGWVDMALYRVVEIFMSVPVLFLLIVAAGVLPRSTYVMMAIIGCFTWHGAARFTRAEFYKLRGQDFVQSARAVGLPLRSILFRHMLPNGVTPVLVDASFAIAAAILFEATLSFLGLGPPDQASWGKLLAGATSEVGDFVPWLAIYPSLAIFLTVLSLTLIGEALRDAIDPKLKKARV